MNASKKIKLDVIIHLEPILADELVEETPLVEAYVGTIRDPKTISKIVLELNSKLPIPELMHLKRINQREVLLILASNDSMSENRVFEILKEKQFDVEKLLENELRRVKVAGIPPKVRKQYDFVQKLWPCNFHANSYLEKLCTNTLFASEELENHADFMKIVIEICKTAESKTACIVTDPSVNNSVVAFGFDQTANNYPTQHAVMVAIDNVAKSQGGGVWNENPLERRMLNELQRKFARFTFGSHNNSRSTSNDGPYLCTDYVVYTTREPCITCAMALVHSRVKRVFYGIKSGNGGLGSLCKIHVVPNLNHHYEVFAGLLQDECAGIS